MASLEDRGEVAGSAKHNVCAANRVEPVDGQYQSNMVAEPGPPWTTHLGRNLSGNVPFGSRQLGAGVDKFQTLPSSLQNLTFGERFIDNMVLPQGFAYHFFR